MVTHELAIKEQLEKFKHIRNILEEKMLLYKRRQKDTKRAMKAIHRAGIIPEPIKVLTILEAEISFVINLAAMRAVDHFVKELERLILGNKKKIDRCEENKETVCQEIIDKLNSIEELSEEFKKQLQTIDSTMPITAEDKNTIESLARVAFSLDENFQRKEIAAFILENVSEFVTRLFKEIVILDQTFTETVIRDLKEYLSKQVKRNN